MEIDSRGSLAHRSSLDHSVSHQLNLTVPEGHHPIFVYLPYLAGTADERQYQVMSDREQWFRVVMGQDEVARLITPDSDNTVPLPEAVSERLNFKLGLEPARTLDI